MKVYVITIKIYNETKIVGVVESKEEAERIAACYIGTNKHTENHIKIIKCGTQESASKDFAFDVEYNEYDDIWNAEVNDNADCSYNKYAERFNRMIYKNQFLIFAKSVNEAINMAKNMRDDFLKQRRRLEF